MGSDLSLDLQADNARPYLAPQLYPDKGTRPDGLRIDPPEEIAVNKVCAMVRRSGQTGRE
jgi:hypothetical protein